MSEIEQTAKQALDHHQAGELEQAECLYRKVLQAEPRHGDVNHNMGVLLIHTGKPGAAVPYLKAAVESNSTKGRYWLSYVEGLLASGNGRDALIVIDEAKRRGLEGPEVDALRKRIAASLRPGPDQSEVESLAALFASGRHAETEALARDMIQAWPNHGFGWKVLGTVLAAQQRFAEALPAIQRTLALLPADPEAHNNLGVALRAGGRLSEAEASYRRVLELNPSHHEAFNNLGNTLQALGRLSEAEACYRRALELKPDFDKAHSNLGNTLRSLGRLAEAEASYRRALELKPAFSGAHSNLGCVLQDLGRFAESEASCRRAIELEPGNHDAYLNLGNALRALERFTEAEVSYRRALQLKPDLHQAHSNLGNTLGSLGRSAEAEASYRRALEISPDYTEAHSNLGNLLNDLGRLAEAESSCRQALKLKPDHHEAHNNLGNTLLGLSRLSEAQACYRRALELKPDFYMAHSNLANALRDHGRFVDAEAGYRRALDLKPDYHEGYDNLLFMLNYHPDRPADEIFSAYREYDERFGRPLRSQWRPHGNDRQPSRRLRVGYVSPDFRKHSCRHFVEPLLDHHDKSVLEVFAYAEVLVEDEVSARMKSRVDHWVSTVGMSDAQMAERIRADGIDILVDLAGHTRGNRLLVFARKPAPVSVTALGYGYTSGLSAIDWYLTDPVSTPEGSERLFSEQPWRISQWGAYRPAEGMGAVSPLPAVKQGRVTFATLTRAVRINHRTVRIWSEILRRVPGSVLVMDSGNFSDAGLRQLLTSQFASCGIEANRLQMGFHSPPWDLLREVDITLDCFPHNSGTTLFESLYMGVPFVSLAGRPSVGRLGSSILVSAGHPEWIAASEDEYADKAVALAADLSKLAEVRAQLRPEMERSPLMNEAGYVRAVETAYREMWRRWCTHEQAQPMNVRGAVDAGR